MTSQISRRELLQTAGVVSAGLAAGTATAAPQAVRTSAHDRPFRFSLNTSTIREQKVGIVREVEIAGVAGYDAIEPWMDTLHRYVDEGGSLPDLKKRIADQRLTVESAIGFALWIVDDDEARKQGLEQAKRDMDLLAQIGGRRIAAPPVGAHDKPGPDLATAAARYRTLLEIGAQIGVIPQVEVWGFSKTLSKLAETVYVAVASEHPQACVLPDVYHLHKGGSGFDSTKLLSGVAVQVFHLNDYPADPPRETISDAHRVYPGDGVAPLTAILGDLRLAGFRGALSLELFNRDYWKQDPLAVARTGLAKMQAAVRASEG
ncbi:MAG: sugar phosphate isomerase/epimerase [Planctomycetaceae bacterium]|nr:sugar phosphate isomerase/epimerase [Planctomycetaceae bacterium]